MSKKTRTSRPPGAADAPVDPPRGLVVRRVATAGEEVVILSFPIRGAGASLTPAERDVLRRVLDGETNARIARARATSERTVANQIASIFRKLGVRSRSELVARRDRLLRA